MKSSYITAILAVTALTFGTGAMAKNMSKSEYKATEKKISAEYQSNQKSCILYAHNAISNTVGACMAEANRTEKLAKADLETLNKPSIKKTKAVGVTSLKRKMPLPKRNVISLRSTSAKFV